MTVEQPNLLRNLNNYNDAFEIDDVTDLRYNANTLHIPNLFF